MPPYSIVEGEVDEKGIDPGGKPYLQVASATVEVDTSSLDGLEVGDRIKIRQTRGHRAVNIDLMLADDDADAPYYP